jgi:hypothetical protein
MAYSYDGNTWTLDISGSNIFTTTCYTIVWSGNMWLAGGLASTSTPVLAYSSDGINWTSTSASPFDSGAIFSLGYNGSIWVGLASGTYSVGYSYNGINWFNSTSGTTILLSGASVAWNGNLWVAVGIKNTTQNHIIYSYDGINWTAAAALSGTVSGFKSVTWNGTLWIAVGTDGSTNYNTAYQSYDGITWTLQTNSGNFYQTEASIVASRIYLQYPFKNNQTLTGSGTSSTGGTLDVSFIFNIYSTAVPIVTAMVTGTSNGFVNVSNITATGFTATTFNTSGIATSGISFNWIALNP